MVKKVRFGEEGEIGVGAGRASEGRIGRGGGRATEVGDGRAIEAGEGLFRRRRGEVDLETNWAEEVTMLLE